MWDIMHDILLYTLVINFKKSEHAIFQIVCGPAEKEYMDPPTIRLNEVPYLSCGKLDGHTL